MSNGRCRWLAGPKSEVPILPVPEFHELYAVVSTSSHCMSKVSHLTHLFGNSRLPYSFEGDPAPALPVAAWAAALPAKPPLPNGNLSAEPAAGSIGELVAEVLAERVCA